MAICAGVPGISVEILVDGRPLQEYEDPDGQNNNARVVNRYVEATSGAKFAEKHTVGRNFPYIHNSLSFENYVDGEHVDGEVLLKDTLRSGSTGTITGKRRQGPHGWTQKDFIFSKLTTDDSDVYGLKKNIKEKIARIGTITVEVFRVDVVNIHRKGTEDKSLLEVGTVSEKALKGNPISHSVGFAPSRAIAGCQVATLDYLNPRDAPLVTFNFMYRSKEALQIIGLIPRSPSPVPLEDRPEESLGREELAELYRREKEKNARIKRERINYKRVKRERTTNRDSTTVSGDSDSGGDVEVVSGPSRKRARRDGPIETIDLTDD
ncbi:hypothetical protein K402DRAFT_346946 [Aulographum hederae CBS 113979]|uniref:DUF7918 domain-containing protein n=1 Tax=Aulographum hederae CBS 113979 TaxID=1176131 RepID=A0A6G1HCV8_9PEZI|nr:hypothetical protein K402DRAFT_346946 [Aulographum hederae CBS 113979]